MQENKARGIFQQLISTVDYCHWKGVANWDIKLENVLLGMKNIFGLEKASLSAGKRGAWHFPAADPGGGLLPSHGRGKSRHQVGERAVGR